MRRAFVLSASIRRMRGEMAGDTTQSADAYMLSIKGGAAEFEVDAVACRLPINFFDHDPKTKSVLPNADPVFSVSNHCSQSATLKP